MLIVAEIVSDVFQSLGNPPSDWLSLKDVVRLVRNRLAFRLTRVVQSAVNQSTVSVSFRLGTYNDNDPISPAPPTFDPREQILQDIGNPIWAERRIIAGDGINSNGSWEYVPTVNLDALEDFRNEGIAAVAFYRDSSLDVMKMRYTFAATEWSDNNSGDNFRIWYDPNVNTQVDLGANSGLPPNLNYMIADEVVASVVPQLTNNVARFSNDGTEVVSQLQLTAWQGIAAAAAARMQDWNIAFEEYRTRSRGGQRGRSRRPVLRRRS